MEEEKAIVCSEITKIFGEGPTLVEALKGVNLTVHPGELLMVAGPSGSGKTTLISIIAGILSPTEGQCRVLGNDLRTMESSKLATFREKNIGFVFKAFNLIPMLSARENVAVPLLLGGMEHEEALGKASELLIRFGLEDKLNEFPSNLSGEQQQRVAIARSSVHDPKLIVCDEPTSRLDHETGTKVMDLFREEILNENRSLVIVTHDARILPYADRIVRLDDGRIMESEVGSG